MQWCTLETSAQRPSPRPSAIHISHSGLRAVELLGHDPADEVAQLLLAARRRQRGAAQVVVEVEVGVVDPDRPAERERHEAHDLAVARDQRELARDHRRARPARRRGTLEDRRPSRCACGSRRPRGAGTRRPAGSSSPCHEACRIGSAESLRPTISIAGRALDDEVGDAPLPRGRRGRGRSTPACYALGSADRSSPAMRCAQARISSQSRQSRYSGAIPEAIDFAMKPPPSSGSRATEDDMVLNAELLHLAEDPGWLQPIGVVVGGIANRARAEHPEGQRGERLAVLAQEVLCVAAPALHVDGTAQDDGVVGCEIPTRSTGTQSTLSLASRRVMATASAISAVEPRLDA